MRIFITILLFFIVTVGSSSDNIYFTNAVAHPSGKTSNNELTREVQTLQDILIRERSHTGTLRRERNIAFTFAILLAALLLVKPVRNLIGNLSSNAETEVDDNPDRDAISKIADRIDRTADRFANAGQLEAELAIRKFAFAVRMLNNLEKALLLEAELHSTGLTNLNTERLVELNRMTAGDISYGDDPSQPADVNTEAQDVTDEQSQLTPSPPPSIGSKPLDETYVPPPPVVSNDNNELQSWDSNPVSAESIWNKIPSMSDIKKMYQDHMSSDNTGDIVPAKTEDVVNDDFIDKASKATSDPDGVASRLKTIRDVPQDALDNVNNALSGNYQSPEEIDKANDEMNAKINKDIAKSIPFVRSFSDVMDKIQSGGKKLADYGTKIKSYFFKSSSDSLDNQ